jgi:hypothetical protein
MPNSNDGKESKAQGSQRILPTLTIATTMCPTGDTTVAYLETGEHPCNIQLMRFPLQEGGLI